MHALPDHPTLGSDGAALTTADRMAREKLVQRL
jgi:hypothetical protein